MTSSAPGGGEWDGLPLDDFVPYLLNRIVARMNRDLVAALRPLGLTQRDWRILAVLSTGDGRTLRELEVYTITPQSTLSRLIDRMVALGLVEKRGMDSE
jgi:MarR family transcriptional regulator, transcriptional regulator for hemolysin